MAEGRAGGSDAGVWLLTLGVILSGAGIAALVGLDSPPPVRLDLPAWILLPAFVLGEAILVRLMIGPEAHDFNLSQIPLTMALFVATPGEALLAALGAAVLVRIARPQPLVKAGFNVAVSALETAIAMGAFHLLATSGGSLDLRHAALAALAVTLTDISTSALVVAVIRIATGSLPSTRTFVTSAAQSGRVAASNSSLALAALAVYAASPSASLLLIPPVVIAYFGYRSYLNVLEERGRLNRLYDFSRQITRESHVAEALPHVVEQLADSVGAEQADIIFLPPGGDGTPSGASVADGQAELWRIEPDAAFVQKVSRWAEEQSGPVLLRTPAGHPLSDWLASRGVADAIVCPLGAAPCVGLVVVGNHDGDVGEFDDDDVRLVGHAAAHAAEVLTRAHQSATVDQLRAQEAHLREAASIDALTGLPNRRAFDQLIADTLADPHSARTGLAFVDLDDFKLVNDLHGHDVGDEVLRVSGHRLSAALRGTDSAARLGGDEFAVIMPSVGSLEIAVAVAERLAREIALPVLLPDGRRIAVSCSVGVSVMDHGEERIDPAVLMRQADQAMYTAKQAGKARVDVFSQISDLGGDRV